MQKKDKVLQKIRSIADYQFGRGVGRVLFVDAVKVAFSKTTGRIRHVYLGNERMATLRPRTGMFSLTITGAKRIRDGVRPLRLWVIVQRNAAPFVAKGRSVFAKHVADADDEICPQEEVIVLDEDSEVLAVGKAILTGAEMKAFKTGVAVRVRRGVAEEVKNPLNKRYC